MIARSKSILILALFATLGVTGARAEDSNDRLLIANGNSGHVIVFYEYSRLRRMPMFVKSELRTCHRNSAARVIKIEMFLILG